MFAYMGTIFILVALNTWKIVNGIIHEVKINMFNRSMDVLPTASFDIMCSASFDLDTDCVKLCVMHNRNETRCHSVNFLLKDNQNASFAFPNAEANATGNYSCCCKSKKESTVKCSKDYKVFVGVFSQNIAFVGAHTFLNEEPVFYVIENQSIRLSCLAEGYDRMPTRFEFHVHKNGPPVSDNTVDTSMLQRNDGLFNVEMSYRYTVNKHNSTTNPTCVIVTDNIRQANSTARLEIKPQTTLLLNTIKEIGSSDDLAGVLAVLQSVIVFNRDCPRVNVRIRAPSGHVMRARTLVNSRFAMGTYSGSCDKTTSSKSASFHVRTCTLAEAKRRKECQNRGTDPVFDSCVVRHSDSDLCAGRRILFRSDCMIASSKGTLCFDGKRFNTFCEMYVVKRQVISYWSTMQNWMTLPPPPMYIEKSDFDCTSNYSFIRMWMRTVSASCQPEELNFRSNNTTGLVFGQTIVIKTRNVTFCVLGDTKGTLTAHRFDLKIPQSTFQNELNFVPVDKGDASWFHAWPIDFGDVPFGATGAVRFNWSTNATNLLYTYVRYVNMDFDVSLSVKGDCGQAQYISCQADLPKTTDLVSEPRIELYLGNRKLKTTPIRAIDKVYVELPVNKPGSYNCSVFVEAYATFPSKIHSLRKNVTHRIRPACIPNKSNLSFAFHLMICLFCGTVIIICTFLVLSLIDKQKRSKIMKLRAAQATQTGFIPSLPSVRPSTASKTCSTNRSKSKSKEGSSKPSPDKVSTRKSVSITVKVDPPKNLESGSPKAFSSATGQKSSPSGAVSSKMAVSLSSGKISLSSGKLGDSKKKISTGKV